MNALVVADYPCSCGENPLWHPNHQLLYWLDVDTGKIYCYDPCQASAACVHQGEITGGMTLQSDGNLLLFMNHGAIATWNPEKGAKMVRRSTPGVEGFLPV